MSCVWQVFSEWSLRSAGCLCSVLEGLLVQYREHHKALLSQSQRLHFELQSLHQSGKYSQVNVHCSRPDEASPSYISVCSESVYVHVDVGGFITPAFSFILSSWLIACSSGVL